MHIKSHSEMETQEVGRKVANKVKKGTVISLRGSLGAGKTVFAKGFARELGITEAIVSPTFTLVQEYDGTLKMYHLDLYRLSGEWSEKIEDMLPEDTIYVDLTINEDLSRDIEIRGLEL